MSVKCTGCHLCDGFCIGTGNRTGSAVSYSVRRTDDWRPVHGHRLDDCTHYNQWKACFRNCHWFSGYAVSGISTPDRRRCLLDTDYERICSDY